MTDIARNNQDDQKNLDIGYSENLVNDELESSQWTTTRTELWSYYLYYIGNNGLSGFNFGPSQFPNLLYLAGYDPTMQPFTASCGDNGCVLPYLGKVRDSVSFYTYQNTSR